MHGLKRIVSMVSLAVLVAGALVPFSAKADGLNIVQNNSFTTSINGTSPDAWLTGSFGTNNAVFSYPVIGRTGGTDAAAEVQISTYTNGDAKWYFQDVPVLAGHDYMFSDWYMSDVSTAVTVRFTLVDNSFKYVDIGTPDLATTWTQFKKTVTAPENSVSATVFHLLAKPGTLIIDDYDFHESLIAAPSAGDEFAQGMVTLSYDDGWLNQYENLAPMLSTAGIHSTFFIISKNTATATTPENLVNAPIVAVNSWSSGIVPVVPGGVYVFSDTYTSSATGSVSVHFLPDGITPDLTIGTTVAGALQNLNPVTILIPNNASITGMVVTHAAAIGQTLSVTSHFLKDGRTYITPAQVLALQSAGHEIGAHSQTHPDLTTLPADQANTQIIGSRSDLLGFGAAPVTVFAYPYGNSNTSVQAQVLNAGFVGARTIDAGFNTRSTNPLQLKAYDGDYPIMSLSEIKSRIDTAVANKTWVILFFHNVDTSGADFTITPTNMQAIIDYITSKNIRTVTVGEGLQLMSVQKPGVPVATPDAGSYKNNATISLSSLNATSIRYTIDGTTPSCGSGIQYTGPFTVTETVTVKAIGCTSEYSSEVASFLYTVTLLSSGGGGGGGVSLLSSAGVSGKVFLDGNQNQVFDVNELGIAGVSVYLDDNDNSVLDPNELVVTTNTQGLYTFSGLSFTSHVIRQVVPNGHYQVYPISNLGFTVTPTVYAPLISGKDFANMRTTAQVLGVNTGTTTTQTQFPSAVSATCPELISRDLFYGIRQNKDDVKKLQQFLNEHQNSKIPVTGYFGPITRSAVMKFQFNHKEEILTPLGIHRATGVVSKYTRAKINVLHCTAK